MQMRTKGETSRAQTRWGKSHSYSRPGVVGKQSQVRVLRPRLSLSLPAMPSFLSKVFGRKKEEARLPQRPPSAASLLDGKFEAVTGTTPTTPRFELPDTTPGDKEKDKEGFALFRTTRSPRASPAVTPGDHAVAQNKRDYHLSLNLPGPKEEASRALGVVFEADPDAQILLPESVIAERKLSPLEAFLLVQACAQTINAHGLETLGIMIPHWYSASPTIQRKLISLFIQSLALKSPITTLSPTASSPVSAFESEISTTRSPHDVAAVLRWGLRHLQLDNSSFGKDEQWYTQFLEAERASEYPPRAFTEKLVPLLPPAHLHLLTAILEIFSSLAAHSEANSISGSKLSKMLGLWILSTPSVEAGEDTLSLYAKWETCGRILEHLFLARIRDEAADHRMPTRLTELVKHYPYAKTASPGADTAFLPSPRFSTRHYDALFVRIETEMPSGTIVKNFKNHPLRLIADALKASTRSPSTSDVTTTGSSSSEVELWESLKKHVSVADADSESYPGLSSLFADETIRFLSLIPTSSESETRTSAAPFTLFIPAAKMGRRRSMSLSDQDKVAAAIASAHVKAASSSTSATSESSDAIAIDWSQFSTSGFFSETGTPGNIASTLLDNKDVEVTIPRVLSARRKLPPALIPLPTSRGKSLDLPAPQEQEPEKEVKQGKSRATKFEIVQLDEAFIDFWSDALLDPISAAWPAFVVCRIKSTVPAINTADSKRVEWLIIEQRFVTPRTTPPPILVTPEKDVPAARPRPNSPKPSFASDSKSTKKKRFSFFTSLSTSSISSSSTNRTDSTKGKKKAGKAPKVGEMGEILKEEEEPSASSNAKTNGAEADVSSAQVAAVATGAVAVGAAAAVATAVAVETPKAEEPTSATLVEDAGNTQVGPTPAIEESESTPPAADATASLVEDAGQVQIPAPTADSDSVPEVASTIEPAQPTVPAVVTEPQAAEPSGEEVAVETAAAIEPDAPEAIAREPTPPPAREPSPPPAVDAQLEHAQAEQERVAAEAEAERSRLEQERLEEERKAQAAAAEAAAQALLAKEAEERERLEQARLEEELRVQAEKERAAAAEEAERLERARLEEERLAEEHRVQAEKERIAAEEAAQALLAKEKAEAEERERVELARLEEERRVQAEQERIAAEEAERARLERERLEEEERLAEERRMLAEKERIAAEEAAQALLAKEAEEQARAELERLEEERRVQAEKERAAAEEAERARVERERLEEEERLRLEEEQLEEERRVQAEKERVAAEEAAQALLAKEKAEAEERERLELARLEEERRVQAEQERIAAEEARLAAEKAEEERLERERVEREEMERAEEERRLEAERARLAAEELEKTRLAAEKAEQERLENERLALEAQQAEEARLAAEKAEQERLEQERLAEEARLAAEKAEQERLEQERLENERLAEEARLAAEKAEQERLEQERLAEEARLAAEKAEQERLEQERLAEEARLAAEKAEQERLEQERLEEEARLAAEKAEQERLEQERLENERLAEEARLAAEKAEQERLENERLAEEARLAAEKAEQERLKNERLAEEARLAAEKAEQERLEQERLAEEARLAAEKAEQERLEQERLEEERRLQAEADRLAAEKAEQERLEQERLEEERRLQAENERLAAEAAEKERLEQERLEEEQRVQAENERLAAEEAETARLEQERAAQDAEVMIVNEEPVAVADAVPEEPAPLGEAAAPVELTPIEPEAPLAEGLQFDTTAEVIGSGHVEPLREPETVNDELVDLPAVPVVDAHPELIHGSTVMSHLELTPTDEAAQGDAADGMLPGGETLGPQAALRIAEEEDAPVHEANGNGHTPEEAEKPAE